MTQRQDFHGNIGQVLQAESVNQYTAVVRVPERRPESQLQAAFKQHTGIDCKREVRLQLERLMEHHGFTAQELARAWNVDSLVWDDQSKRLKSGSRTVDITAGWAGVIALTVALVISLAETMFSAPGLFVKPVLLMAICIVYLYITRFVLLATIFPQVTARRVEKTQMDLQK